MFSFLKETLSRESIPQLTVTFRVRCIILEYTFFIIIHHTPF